MSKGYRVVWCSVYKTAIFIRVKSLGSEVVSDDGEVFRIGFWTSTVWQKARSVLLPTITLFQFTVYFTKSILECVTCPCQYTLYVPSNWSRERACIEVECWTFEDIGERTHRGICDFLYLFFFFSRIYKHIYFYFLLYIFILCSKFSSTPILYAIVFQGRHKYSMYKYQ